MGQAGALGGLTVGRPPPPRDQAQELPLVRLQRPRYAQAHVLPERAKPKLARGREYAQQPAPDGE